MTISENGHLLELDALIVGAGFSGIYILHRLRDQLGLHVKIVEAGSDLGGVWNNNVYPGARVDVAAPLYGFAMAKVYQSWKWSQAYPDQKELKAYFDHVDQVLSIKKDCIFNSRVNAASFSPQEARWTVHTEDGKTLRAKYFIPAIGFAEQHYVPPWKGLDLFQGTIYHSSQWPREGVDVKGKRVAVIGTGATAVQIIQEWATEAAELVVFQRTPNFALPMHRDQFDSEEQRQIQDITPEAFARAWETSSGFNFPVAEKAFADYEPEEAEALLNKLYDQGGFNLWLCAFTDVLMNPEANRFTYDMWAKRVRARIHDPAKRDLLAPLEPPHPFGGKRASLEYDYYEQFNRPNVHLVSTSADPIVEVTTDGIVTDDGKLYQVDTIAMATGFNSTTGGFSKMNIRDLNGVDLADRWKDGVRTYLGLMVPGFPNMFLPYCVQAPTPFTNGPVFIEFQANFIRDIVKKMERDGTRSLDPLETSAEAWRAEVHALGDMTLFPKAKSWYMGANIPGKPVEMLYYFGGIPRYRESCETALEKLEKLFICH
jgi:cation diffusion facilitator CzcD-associated flavoprotein CzcO